MEGQEGTATEEAPEQGAGEATDQGEADREDNGEEGALERPSRKALKRKAKAEKCLEWKAQQKAKRKRGGQRHKGPPLPPNGESGRPEGEGPTQRLGAEEVKAQRLLRKAKELEDFRERSGRGTTVVLDLEWEEQMQPKELKSLIQQVLYCYGANRKSSHPTRLVFSGVKEGSKTYEGLSKQSGYESWEVQKLSGPYIEAFPKEKLIYLTADAPEVLDTFDPEKVYVIGGIVDRNRLKGASMAKASEQQIAAQQLPLAKYVEMGSYSRVLTVNHVVNMILDHQATSDWRGVCERCVPGRKHLKALEEVEAAADVESAADGTACDDRGETTG